MKSTTPPLSFTAKNRCKELMANFINNRKSASAISPPAESGPPPEADSDIANMDDVESDGGDGEESAVSALSEAKHYQNKLGNALEKLQELEYLLDLFFSHYPCLPCSIEDKYIHPDVFPH